MKDKGISTYALIHKHKISNGTLYRMRQGKPVKTTTIDDLCKALKCMPNDIILFIDDEE
jgi:DNA-binding Xre family transcriptional regulator